jgi:NAD(P)-dependent dehydrogenase (short-subunit alcohol dehydrogenase family)
VYGISKYGLEGLTCVLAEELRDQGIAVNSVAPGLVATELSNWEGLAPEAVVDVFVYLASGRASGISGRALYAPSWRSELGLR